MLPDLVVPMIPRGLCGLDGCVYTKGHTCDHSWMRPFDSDTTWLISRTEDTNA